MTMPRLEPTPLSDCLAKAHPKNPKEHDIPSLIASFARFGFVAFPTIDENTDVMVAGHGRCEALSQMKSSGASPPRGVSVRDDGEWMVPVTRGVSFASEAERDAYVVADNQMTIAGGWNLDRLTSLLEEIRPTGFDGMGFGAVDLDSLLGRFTSEPPPGEQPPPEDDPDAPPEKFVSHDITVETTYRCPKCSYEWSGKAK